MYANVFTKTSRDRITGMVIGMVASRGRVSCSSTTMRALSS